MDEPHNLEPVDVNDKRAIYDLGPVSLITAKKGTVLADHTHQYAEIFTVVTGSADLMVGDKTMRLKPLSQITVPSDVYHKMIVAADIVFIEEIPQH